MKSLNRESGFTFIEVLVAEAILIIGTLALWSVFVAGSRYNSESENRTVATNIAQYLMEETIENLTSTDFEDVMGTGEVAFESQPQGPPFWALSSANTSQESIYWEPELWGEWTVSLPEGKYEVSYPDSVTADPLRILVTISWQSNPPRASSLEIQTLVSRK